MSHPPDDVGSVTLASSASTSEPAKARASSIMVSHYGARARGRPGFDQVAEGAVLAGSETEELVDVFPKSGRKKGIAEEGSTKSRDQLGEEPDLRRGNDDVMEVVVRVHPLVK